MIRTPLGAALTCLVLGVTCAACVTQERTRLGGHILVRNVNEDEEGKDMREEQLLDAVEQDPKSKRGWWRLGAYYESIKRYRQAIQAYEQLQALTEEAEKETGRRFTGALYLLGKVHTLAKNFQPAVAYFQRVLALKPKDMRAAIGIPDFAESHYLLGAIYYEHRMYPDAEKHLIAFRELRPGDRRADTMLIGIEDAVYPERRSYYAESDDAPQRGAAKVNTTRKGSVRVEGEEAPAESPKEETPAAAQGTPKAPKGD